MKRDEFLARLAARPAGAHLPGASPGGQAPAAPADLASAFIAAARASGGGIVRGDGEALRAALRELCGGGPLYLQDAPALRELAEGLPRVPPGGDPFLAACGLSLAEAGLARTGSACLRRTPGHPLTASLVPPVAAIVVPEDRLFWELGDYLRAAPAAGTVHVVTGPSRSADIENDLSIGVHGPKDVLLLLLVR